ncbi:MAG: hypothetical protein JKY37_01720, partial [Nannocystaceae bacterium]|nr:hypothetical protein [Nannocystaceae bacterium]
MPQWYRTALLMPSACSFSIPTSLCLALAVLTASARPVRGAPSSQRGPAPVLVWPSDTERDIEALETVLQHAGHAVLPFAPVAEVLRRGRGAHRALTQSKLAVIEEGLARAQ